MYQGIGGIGAYQYTDITVSECKRIRVRVFEYQGIGVPGLRILSCYGLVRLWAWLKAGGRDCRG